LGSIAMPFGTKGTVKKREKGRDRGKAPDGSRRGGMGAHLRPELGTIGTHLLPSCLVCLSRMCSSSWYRGREGRTPLR
jgi:hypothetical protein